jgi:hypothetical protein
LLKNIGKREDFEASNSAEAADRAKLLKKQLQCTEQRAAYQIKDDVSNEQPNTAFTQLVRGDRDTSQFLTKNQRMSLFQECPYFLVAATFDDLDGYLVQRRQSLELPVISF